MAETHINIKTEKKRKVKKTMRKKANLKTCKMILLKYMKL